MKNKQEKYVWLFFVVFSTAFSFAIGPRQENYLLILLMLCSPAFLLIHFPFINKKEFILLYFFSAYFVCSIIHYESFRASTIIYTLLFILSYVYYMRLIYVDALTCERYLVLIKFLIVSYCVVLMIQQLCVFFNLPIFNWINTWEDAGSYKLNSLSPEPSHTSRILLLLMYSYVIMKELLCDRKYDIGKDFFKDKLIWFCFLYTLLTMRSGSAFFFLPFFAFLFLNIKSSLYIFSLSAVLIVVMSSLDIVPVNRAIVFAKSVATLDPEKVWAADYSASFRVVPTILYFKNFNIFSLDTWIGYGIDYNVSFFPPIIKFLPEGRSVGGMIPTFLLNHGLIPAILLMIFVSKFCLKKIISYDFLLWLLLIAVVPLNTQLTWFSFMIFGTNKYFLLKYAREIK